MNTPPEMFRSTYVAYSGIDGDQEAAMREIHRGFKNEEMLERYKRIPRETHII